MTEAHVFVTARARVPARLDDPGIAAPDPSVAELAELARGAGDATTIVLTGGEPTLRADLPELLAAVRAPVLRTDALALASDGALRPLQSAGLSALRVVLHSARPEAHDWLVGQPGAARLAMRALLRASELGVRTEIEATLTRPTAPHLAELAVLAERVGARALHVVRLRHRGTAEREAIALVPRFAQLEDPLDETAAAALRARITLRLHDFPRCVAPRLASAFAPSAERTVLVPSGAGWSELAVRAPRSIACAACPRSELCAGAPAEYVARFGSGEILSEQPRPERPHVDAPPAGAPKDVAPRAGRAPTTRLRDVRAIVRRGGVEGDPLIDEPRTPPPTLRLSLAPIETSTRVLRARLIRAAQEGARVLRLSGGFDHPAAAALLVEAARLPGVSVELAGDLRPLFALKDAQIYELRGIARARAALRDPADVEPTLAFLERLRATAQIEIGTYVVLGSAADAAAWTNDFARLPGDPFVRVLDPTGLADLATTLAPSPLRDALGRAPAETAPPAFVDEILAHAPIADDEPFGAA